MGLPTNVQQTVDEIKFSIALSPAGHLYLDTCNTQETISLVTAQKIQDFWHQNYAIGLLRLGLKPLPTVNITVDFWQKFAREFIAQICKHPNVLEMNTKTIPIISTEELQTFVEQAPFMIGGEYLNLDLLTSIWIDLNSALLTELDQFNGKVQDYFLASDASWNLVGRVCFHLAENKDDHNQPFAFLATYATRLGNNAQAQHLPLGKALQEYADEKNKPLLIALLSPVQKAAEVSPFIKELVDSGRIFKPLAWKVEEAYRFLKQIYLFESVGIVIRVPNWWNSKKPNRPQVMVNIGKNNTGVVGADALLDFDMHLALRDGQRLTNEEWQAILTSKDNLVKIKGQWVEVNREKLQEVLAHWRKVEDAVQQDGLSFTEGMRLLAGFTKEMQANSETAVVHYWSLITAGTWLKETLHNLHDSNNTQAIGIINEKLNASLRPYQTAGVHWLSLLYNLRLGGCLADDMGLGKTIQVLALLLLVKYQIKPNLPYLIVVPSSLLGNWQAEIIRFAPSLRFFVAHSSAEKDFKQMDENGLKNFDVVFTTYSLLYRLPWLTKQSWDMVILDEAQLIKNPTAKQTKAAKSLSGKVRFVLTGTPIENSLMDLWSLFDFITPGLLGSQKAFSQYGKKTQENGKERGNFFTALRALVNPYILRRLKSDKTIIADLPDKTELNAYCSLSKQQISLYQQAIEELAYKLKHSDGMQRRGLILAYLLRLKQICNHPCQWLGHGDYRDEDSGKFMRLKELCATIAAKQEKVLIFTQFREVIPALAAYLAAIFQKEGLVLHGGTNIKLRSKLVRSFQEQEGALFFVLSLKAGGTGLNLTGAQHVIHFDRWWNPAVENQATDRAYRIGQKKNVLVHKFISRGTIEEKIDTLINEKKSLSKEVLAGNGEISFTELSNEELLRIVSLDIHRAMEDIS